MGERMDDERADADFLHEQAPAYARLALANVRRAYPVHVTYVATGPAPPPGPRAAPGLLWQLRLALLCGDALESRPARAAVSRGGAAGRGARIAR